MYNPKAKEWEAETFEDHGDVISSLTLAHDGTRLISSAWRDGRYGVREFLRAD